MNVFSKHLTAIFTRLISPYSIIEKPPSSSCKVLQVMCKVFRVFESKSDNKIRGNSAIFLKEKSLRAMY